ncbi:hypothetical protein BABINDRAFT_83516 [Babjeviella inositovora NRRL Y-12698]|uniref:WD repeat-containing protein JIP5 n=1 Tax=Babjeviella inositovora NRRL Y-12698 TaxID=984486 RepID=A0A1E3QL56_9ASCO|nr:uncharacterized protein BABINDRAFT_83516 [Babjeviella inositovora NRRL Y-12698]ODQ78415.1 hypothetical protein BABINDRAFT_83516 [Babjeviella inositovora NRRL Y-12698]
MAKSKKKSNQLTAALESRVAPCLEFNFDDPIFAVAAHPTSPLIATGLGTGHVYMHKYNGERLEERAQAKKESYELSDKGRTSEKKTVSKSIYQSKKKWWGVYDAQNMDEGDEDFSMAWKTRRHKGSCRSVVFDSRTGEDVYTIGTDKIIKMASSATGKVINKIPTNLSVDGDQVNKLLHSATEHNFLVAGTEAGDVHVYDSRTLGDKFTVKNVHEDAVNYMAQMSATSSYHFLSVGSTTLVHFDIRKGVITTSDEQDDEIMSMCFPDVTDNNTVAAGMGEGVVTMWKKDKNNFRDQLTRVRVSRDNSIDCMISTMDNEDEGDAIWAGCSDGILHKVDVRRGKLTECRVHGLDDEILAVDLDHDYRLISAGMENIKIWSNTSVQSDNVEGSDAEDSDVNGSGVDGSDVDGNDAANSDGWSDIDSDAGDNSGGSGKDGSDSESLNPSDFGSDEPSEDESEPSVFQRKRRITEAFVAKLTKKKLIDLNKGVPKQPVVEDEDQVAVLTKKQKKKAQLSSKQLKNMQDHEHGIRKFADL